MPQASEEQRQEWGIDDAPVIRFLENRGYILTGKWEWTHPNPEHWQPTDKELSASNFLIDEWDFGGFTPEFACHPTWMRVLPLTDIRMREHNQGIIAFLNGSSAEPPDTCRDPEGWRRGYASAHMAMTTERK